MILAAVNRRVRRAIRAGGRRIWTAADLDSRAGSASTAPGTAIAILRLQDGQIRDAWVLRAETYAAANAPLIAAQADIALAQAWGGGLLAGVDGVRFVVPVRSIDARPNPRYFGRRRGMTLLNLVNDQAVGLAGHVVSGTPRVPQSSHWLRSGSPVRNRVVCSPTSTSQ